MDKPISAAERRAGLEKKLKIGLKNIGLFTLDESVASSKNCENMIGAVQIPVGVAGPVMINSKNILIPLATTEGALVASVNRGCKAIVKSGGARVLVEKIGTTRGPVFKTSGLFESDKFIRWLDGNLDAMRKVASGSDKYIKLKKVEPVVNGNYVFVRFVFDTDRAMGMNMVTIATSEIAKLIERKTGIECLSLSGNFCVDKKPSWQNIILGRGYKINAEVLLTKKVLKNVLKTSAKKFFDVWLGKCMVGSAMAGSMGFNAHFGNIIAAIFIATGQDPAHITEGSLGITTAEIIGSGLRVGIYLPDIMVGTIGGGTGLETQKEALSIIGVNNFVEAIGGAVLAGEISLLSSFSEGSLVKAHVKLGRGDPTSLKLRGAKKI